MAGTRGTMAAPRGLAALARAAFALAALALAPSPAPAVGDPAVGDSPAGAAAPDTSAAPLAVRVREEPAADRWQVTYRLPPGADGLWFQRHRDPSRGAWEVVTPGVSWTVREGRDALAAESPVAEITLRFASDFASPVKGYGLNFSFTDGGRLLYSGDLSVRPLAAGEALPIPDHHWRLQTTAGRWVAVLGEEAAGELDWREPAGASGNGTYAYFGPRRPERRQRMSYVLDPGLPAWLGEEAEALLPRLVDHFARLTAVELSFRPLVLVSYQPVEMSGVTFKGGTLDGLVQMAAIGSNWEERTPDVERMWRDRVAHEIFHFWAGEMFETPFEGGDAWLKEGGADRFALAAMESLGLASPADTRRRLVETANRCLTGLEGEPLLESARPGRFGNLYACGALIWQWAGAAVGRSGGSGDAGEAGDGLGELLRALLAAAPDGELTSYGFLEALHRATGDASTGAPIARLLFHGVPEGADRFFAERLLEAGLPVELVAPAAATLPPGAAPPAAGHPSWQRLLALVDG